MIYDFTLNAKIVIRKSQIINFNGDVHPYHARDRVLFHLR
jgi:hypothetical protein